MDQKPREGVSCTGDGLSAPHHQLEKELHAALARVKVLQGRLTTRITQHRKRVLYHAVVARTNALMGTTASDQPQQQLHVPSGSSGLSPSGTAPSTAPPYPFRYHLFARGRAIQQQRRNLLVQLQKFVDLLQHGCSIAHLGDFHDRMDGSTGLVVQSQSTNGSAAGRATRLVEMALRSGDESAKAMADGVDFGLLEQTYPNFIRVLSELMVAFERDAALCSWSEPFPNVRLLLEARQAAQGSADPPPSAAGGAKGSGVGRGLQPATKLVQLFVEEFQRQQQPQALGQQQQQAVVLSSPFAAVPSFLALVEVCRRPTPALLPLGPPLRGLAAADTATATGSSSKSTGAAGGSSATPATATGPPQPLNAMWIRDATAVPRSLAGASSTAALLGTQPPEERRARPPPKSAEWTDVDCVRVGEDDDDDDWQSAWWGSGAGEADGTMPADGGAWLASEGGLPGPAADESPASPSADAYAVSASASPAAIVPILAGFAAYYCRRFEAAVAPRGGGPTAVVDVESSSSSGGDDDDGADEEEDGDHLCDVEGEESFLCLVEMLAYALAVRLSVEAITASQDGSRFDGVDYSAAQFAPPPPTAAAVAEPRPAQAPVVWFPVLKLPANDQLFFCAAYTLGAALTLDVTNHGRLRQGADPARRDPVARPTAPAGSSAPTSHDLNEIECVDVDGPAEEPAAAAPRRDRADPSTTNEAEETEPPDAVATARLNWERFMSALLDATRNTEREVLGPRMLEYLFEYVFHRIPEAGVAAPAPVARPKHANLVGVTAEQLRRWSTQTYTGRRAVWGRAGGVNPAEVLEAQERLLALAPSLS